MQSNPKQGDPPAVLRRAEALSQRLPIRQSAVLSASAVCPLNAVPGAVPPYAAQLSLLTVPSSVSAERAGPTEPYLREFLPAALLRAQP